MCGRAPPHPLTASTRSPPPIHPLTCRLLHPSSLHLRVRPTPRHTPPLHQYILVLLSPLFSQHFSPLLILPPPDSHSASLPFFPVFQSLIFPTHTHTSCCSLRLLLLRNTVPLCVDVIITQHLLLLWNTDEQQERDNKRTTEGTKQNHMKWRRALALRGDCGLHSQGQRFCLFNNLPDGPLSLKVVIERLLVWIPTPKLPNIQGTVRCSLLLLFKEGFQF